jgi:cold shock CspA family protein
VEVWSDFQQENNRREKNTIFRVKKQLKKAKIGEKMSENDNIAPLKGVVKWFDAVVRYGFIEVKDENDYFVHMKNVVGDTPLKTGDVVIFIPSTNPKGLIAIDVRVLNGGDE